LKDVFSSADERWQVHEDIKDDACEQLWRLIEKWLIRFMLHFLHLHLGIWSDEWVLRSKHLLYFGFVEVDYITVNNLLSKI
jgi:hypothetical protein